MRMQRAGFQGRYGRLGSALALVLLLGASGAAFAADPTKGRVIYMTHCQNCHGANGVGQLPGMPDFSRGESLFRPDIELVRAILAGRGMMPAYRGMFTEEELLDVVAFLRTLR
jgi:mono/diheme cytochrome c family protein